jgi:hypothetical protein
VAGAFGYLDRMRRGVAISVIAGAAVDTMPVEYLYDPQPGLRARLLPAAGAVTLQFDFGQTVAIGLVMLVNTTLTGAETVRVQLNNTDDTFATGIISNTVHAATGADETRGAVVCMLPADIGARYMRVLITDIGPDILDIGSIIAMATLRMERNEEYGGREGRLYLGAADANSFTGASFRVPGLGAPRFIEFSLASIRQHEAPAFRTMFATLIASDDVVYVPEVTQSQADLNRRAIYGAMSNPGDRLAVTRLNYAYSRLAFVLTERF